MWAQHTRAISRPAAVNLGGYTFILEEGNYIMLTQIIFEQLKRTFPNSVKRTGAYFRLHEF